MAIATLDDYKRALTSGRNVGDMQVRSVSATTGALTDLWKAMAPVGYTPSSPIAPSSQDSLISIANPGASLQNSIVGFRMSAFNPGTFVVCDRLSHQGGLSGTVVGAQTTNLPTDPLLRYVDGEGVMIGVTIYTQIGATGTTISASYTNQAGVAGRTTPLVQIGATRFREANRLILLPLQAGDTGVQSVESVSLTATTGTAGNFGVTLFRPLYAMAVESLSGVASGGFVTGFTGGGVARIESDACLFLIGVSASTNCAGCGTLIMEEN